VEGQRQAKVSPRRAIFERLGFSLAPNRRQATVRAANPRAELPASRRSLVGAGPANHRRKPLVSIIIPAFNHEQFIGHCLDSIMADEYPAKEIVVIDDGSSDGTLGVVSAWACRHRDTIPISLVSRPNRGVTRTLNELLLKAQGEFVMPVASDDYLLPGGLQTLATTLMENPTCHAAFGDSVVVNEGGDVIYQSTLFDYRRANRSWLTTRLTEAIITDWAVPGSAMMYRREPILSIGGYNEHLLVEDWDFYLRLVSRGWLRFVDCRVAAYRLHEGNAHRSYQDQKLREKQMRDVALAAARRFRGRRRLLLLLEAMTYSPPFLGLRPGRVADLPGRAARKVIRMSARAFASLG